MEISLDNLGKRYRQEWIIRHLSFQRQQPDCIALLGPNGSGKSTLLRLLAGLTSPSEGIVSMTTPSGRPIEPEERALFCSFPAPYMDLPEELTLDQLIQFHFQFRPLLADLQLEEIPTILKLEKFKGAAVKTFSSGMKQRLKLALALLTDAPYIFLDEPLTNLDNSGGEWYYELIKSYTMNRTLWIASNRPDEYPFCSSSIQMNDYKKS